MHLLLFMNFQTYRQGLAIKISRQLPLSNSLVSCTYFSGQGLAKIDYGPTISWFQKNYKHGTRTSMNISISIPQL